MYHNIVVPVDIEHADKLEKALATACDLAKAYDAKLTVVGVTSTAPGSLAHSPAEFSGKLKVFAEELTARTGVTINNKTEMSHDPSVDMDDVLIRAIKELNADLVVMASHVPGFREYIFHSRAGYLASHAKISVFVVR